MAASAARMVGPPSTARERVPGERETVEAGDGSRGTGSDGAGHESRGGWQGEEADESSFAPGLGGSCEDRAASSRCAA